MHDRKSMLVLAIFCVVTAALALALRYFRTGSDDTPVNALRTEGLATVDLGTLDRNQEGSFRFTVRNVGSETVQLGRLWTTCGCTVLELDRKQVAPGDTIQVSGRLDTSQPGRRRADIYIDVGGRPFHVGEVRFGVRHGWIVHPPSPELRIDDGSRRALELPITLICDEAAKVEGKVAVRTVCPGIELRHDVRGDTVRIRPVIADPAAVPYGRFAAPIEARSESRNAPLFQFDLNIRHHPDLVRTDPASLASPVTFQGSVVRLRFRLRFRGVPAIVHAIETWSDAATIRAWTAEPDGVVDVTFQPHPELQTSRAVLLIAAVDGARVAVDVVLAMRPRPGAEEE